MNPPVQATEANWYDSYSFDVQIDGITRAAFQKCSGLTATVESIDYAEGGALTDNHSPGRVSFSDLVLERGETPDTDLYDWFTSVYNPQTGRGAAHESQYKRNCVVRQLDRAGNVVRRWSVVKAWPSEFKLGDWANDSNDKHIESLTLKHEGFELM